MIYIILIYRTIYTNTLCTSFPLLAHCRKMCMVKLKQSAVYATRLPDWFN